MPLLVRREPPDRRPPTPLIGVEIRNLSPVQPFQNSGVPVREESPGLLRAQLVELVYHLWWREMEETPKQPVPAEMGLE